ncbi:MAG: chemotaxis-specific protein-glutamate methyltransferase CheB [Spirochaetales bacterium]|nr:chemotaxis-specific protein-glutamate methyltransferase CheB [Spirochaetales bacterium]
MEVLNQNIKHLLPNEYIFTNEDLVIHTILGTCVSIILYSPENGYTGILHGLISERFKTPESRKVASIEELFQNLLDEFLKRGVASNKIFAKVFGAAQPNKANKIILAGKQNELTALEIIQKNNIPITAQDMGGDKARKLILYTATNEVHLNFVKDSMIINQEQEIINQFVPESIITEKQKQIQVLIVDDSAVVRNVMEEILNSDPEIHVMGTAADPFFAAEKIKTMVPDVISLDIEMPRMDGISFLKIIMKQMPVPVVICSSLTGDNTKTALEAMSHGAVEIITKPRMQSKEFLEESRIRICDTIKAAAKVKVKPVINTSGLKIAPKLSADAIISPVLKKQAMSETTEKLIAIGASTGGTEAISEILLKMSIDCPGIIIVQHMPEMFTKSFAERLDSICAITVKEAQNGDSVLKGHALIAPGNKHMLLNRSGARYFVEIKEGPLVNRHRPSVDVLFRATARYGGSNALGIILTGMGDDGAKGLLEMRTAGAFTIAQDEKSSVVFGMPNEAIKLGGASKVLGLSQIPGFIQNYFA